MRKPGNSTIAPDKAWQTPASTWGEVVDRYVSFVQVPTWRASVKRDGSERSACLSTEQAEALGRRMRKVLDRLDARRGQPVTHSVPSRVDLADLWQLQGKQVVRSERCPTNLQTHFQRAYLLNEAGYACAYCGRTAWGVYAEHTEVGPRTLRFEVDHRTTRRRLADPKKFDSGNLLAACRSCNVIKAEMSESAFRAELASLAAAVGVRAVLDR